MSAVQLSPAAYERLKAEFEDLTTRGRIEVANKIERAREEGDLKENAGYHAAKDEQGHMEGRIRQLEHLLENAEITDGSSVYTILYEGDAEADAERYLIGNMEEQFEGADVISASMLYAHLTCPHRVSMDAHADPALRDPVNPFVEMLWDRGTPSRSSTVRRAE